MCASYNYTNLHYSKQQLQFLWGVVEHW